MPFRSAPHSWLHKILLASLLSGFCSLGLHCPVQAEPAWKAPYQAGSEAQRQGDDAQALRAYERALELAPPKQQARILRLRAEVYQYRGELALAWLDLSYALLLSPDDPSLYEGLGWLQIYHHDYPAAVRALTQAAQLERAQRGTKVPNLWIPLNLGLALYLNGEPEKAWSIWGPHLNQRLGSGNFSEALEKDFKRLIHDGWSAAQFQAARRWLVSQLARP